MHSTFNLYGMYCAKVDKDFIYDKLWATYLYISKVGWKGLRIGSQLPNW